MKIDTQEVQLESNLEGSTFGIRERDMGLVLGILRNNMYQDPIGSICREIMSNALDAHTDAGIQDRPIEVTIPNRFESNYKVRDFGTGMSPDLIQEIYTNYCASTKRARQDQIGGWGLGSKTPWSYTDTFSIITRYQGVKYSYSCYIDDTQKGKIFLLGEEETAEESGTTISIPTKAADVSTFLYKTKLFSSYFKVKPNILGTSEVVKYVDPERVIEGTGWYIAKSNVFDPRSSVPIVLVGCIPYRIDKASISPGFAKTSPLLNTNLVIESQIGKVSVVASRENLNYDIKTNEFLHKTIKEIASELSQVIGKNIEQADNMWDAGLAYQTYDSYIRNLVPANMTKWRGHPIENRIKFDPKVLALQVFTLNNHSITLSNPSYADNIYINSNVLVYENDIGLSTSKDYIRTILNDNPDFNIKVLRRVKDVKDPLGFDPQFWGVKKLSSVTPTKLPRATAVTSSVKAATVRRPKNTIKALLYDPSKVVNPTAIGVHRYCTTEYVNLDTVNYYFEVYKGQAKMEGFYNLTTVLIDAMGIKVYAIQTSEMSKLEGSAWIKVEDHITEYCKEIIKNHKEEVGAAIYHNTYFSFYEKTYQVLMSCSSLVKNKDSVFHKYIETYKTAATYRERFHKGGNAFIFTLLSQIYPDIYNPDELYPVVKDFNKLYPLISVIIDSYRLDQIKHLNLIADYVNMVDVYQSIVSIKVDSQDQSLLDLSVASV